MEQEAKSIRLLAANQCADAWNRALLGAPATGLRRWWQIGVTRRAQLAGESRLAGRCARGVFYSQFSW